MINLDETLNKLIEITKREQKARYGLINSEIRNKKIEDIQLETYSNLINELTEEIYKIISHDKVNDAIELIKKRIEVNINLRITTNIEELNEIYEMLSAYYDVYAKTKIDSSIIKAASTQVINEEIYLSLYSFMKRYYEITPLSEIEKLYFIDLLNNDLGNGIAIKLSLAGRDKEAEMFSSVDNKFNYMANTQRKKIIIERIKTESSIIPPNIEGTLSKELKTLVEYFSAKIAMYFIYLEAYNVNYNPEEFKIDNSSINKKIIERASQIYETLKNKANSQKKEL